MGWLWFDGQWMISDGYFPSKWIGLSWRMTVHHRLIVLCRHKYHVITCIAALATNHKKQSSKKKGNSWRLKRISGPWLYTGMTGILDSRSLLQTSSNIHIINCSLFSSRSESHRSLGWSEVVVRHSTVVGCTCSAAAPGVPKRLA